MNTRVNRFSINPANRNPNHRFWIPPQPSTSSVTSDEKVDYVQVDKEKTQALQNTMQEWTDVRQSAEPVKGVKSWHWLVKKKQTRTELKRMLGFNKEKHLDLLKTYFLEGKKAIYIFNACCLCDDYCWSTLLACRTGYQALQVKASCQSFKNRLLECIKISLSLQSF